jgi:hypothetical protein
MPNKTDKIFISAAITTLLSYVIPWIFMAWLLINGMRDETALIKYDYLITIFIRIIGVFLIVLCHISYFTLFWTLYKKIKESQKIKMNVFLLVIYTILLLFFWLMMLMP